MRQFFNVFDWNKCFQLKNKWSNKKTKTHYIVISQQFFDRQLHNECHDFSSIRSQQFWLIINDFSIQSYPTVFQIPFFSQISNFKSKNQYFCSKLKPFILNSNDMQIILIFFLFSFISNINQILVFLRN